MDVDMHLNSDVIETVFASIIRDWCVEWHRVADTYMHRYVCVYAHTYVSSEMSSLLFSIDAHVCWKKKLKWKKIDTALSMILVCSKLLFQNKA